MVGGKESGIITRFQVCIGDSEMCAIYRSITSRDYHVSPVFALNLATRAHTITWDSLMGRGNNQHKILESPRIKDLFGFPLKCGIYK